MVVAFVCFLLSGTPPLTFADNWYRTPDTLTETKGDGQGELQRSMRDRQELFRGVNLSDGPVVVRAEKQFFDERNGTVRLEGQVQLWQGGNLYIEADRATVDERQQTVTASGNVSIRVRNDQISGERLQLSFTDQTGFIEDAKAYFAPSFYVEAERLEVLLPHPESGNLRFRVHGATVSSCTPDGEYEWSIRAGNALIHLEHNIQFYHARFRIWKMPAMYLPYMYIPIKADRSPGLLIPSAGQSDHAGWYLMNQLYLPLGDHADSIFAYTTSEEAGDSQSFELRYNLNETSVNNILRVERRESSIPITQGSGSLLTGSDQNLWDIYFNHNQDVLREWRLNLRSDLVIAEQPNEDFTDEPGVTYFQQDFRSYATLKRQWNRLRLTGELNYDEYYGLTDRSQIFTGPEIHLDVVQLRLGQSDFYFDSRNEVQYAWKRTVDELTDGDRELEDSLWRGQTDNTLRYEFNQLPWLSVTPRFQAVSTFYAKGKDDAIDSSPGGTWLTLPDTGGTDYRAYDPLLGVEESDLGVRRDQYSTGVQVEGPRFIRIFEMNWGKLEKLRHQIEPLWDYTYTPGVEYGDVPIIGAFGNPLPERNLLTFVLQNEFRGRYRRGINADGKQQYRDQIVANIDIRQSYDIALKRAAAEIEALGLEDERFSNPWSYTIIDVTLFPGERRRGDLEVQIDPLDLEHKLVSFRQFFWTPRLEIDSTFSWRRKDSLVNFGDESVSSISAGLRWRPHRAWEIEATDTYNITEDLHQYLAGKVTWKGQCWGLSFATIYRQRESLTEDLIIEDTSFEFSLYLRNLGQLGGADIERYGR